MAALPLDQHPGEEYIYGYNTDILGAVIEVASGKNLSTFLTEELFKPLAMTDTHFFLPQDKAARLSVVYEPAPEGGIRAIDSSDGMQSQGLYVQGRALIPRSPAAPAYSPPQPTMPDSCK